MSDTEIDELISKTLDLIEDTQCPTGPLDRQKCHEILKDFINSIPTESKNG